MPAVRPPFGKATARCGRPSPARRASRGGPAGTRLPIPYMDKCVQAKSGIQAPDVSLQLSGHRTGDRGGGGGDGGEEGGGKAPTSSRSSPAEVSLFVCGFAPGPRASFPGISSFSERGTAGHCKVRDGCTARGAGRGAGRRGRACPGLGTMGGGVPGHLLLRLCLRLQPPPPPPLPLLPPPRGIVANPPSFPPTLRPRAPREPPALPGRERLRGGRSAGAGRGVRALPGPQGPRCGSAGRGAITGCTPWGRGPRVFLEALTTGWARLELFPTRPLPGLCSAPRGRGHTQPLRAFAESQLSQWKGPRNLDVQASHFTVGATEVQRKGGPPPKSVT